MNFMTCKNLKYNASDKSPKTDKTKRSLTNKRMKKKNAIKDLENTQKVYENTDSPKEETDNPHDKGYKRIFSIKKNYLDFIKKYIGFDWMIELTEKD